MRLITDRGCRRGRMYPARRQGRPWRNPGPYSFERPAPLGVPNIVGPRDVATRINASIAAYHSAASYSAFGILVCLQRAELATARQRSSRATGWRGRDDISPLGDYAVNNGGRGAKENPPVMPAGFPLGAALPCRVRP